MHWQFLLNVAVALVLGVAIGLERQYRQRTAGLRTNTLVCVGAAFFVSLGVLLEGRDPTSTARMASYVVSGIGFLGGDVILREGLNVRGMSTAATLWCSAAVGALAASGWLAEAAVGTVIVLAIHLGLRPVVRKIAERIKMLPDTDAVYQVRVLCQASQTAVIRNVFMRHVNSQANMMVHGISTRDTEQAGIEEVIVDIFCSVGNDRYMNELVARLNIEPGVTGVSWKKA
jgi:putative Mg2+ transporter-C (MgtC) family protein